MKQTILRIGVAVLAMLLLALVRAQAEPPQSIPKGPWIQDQQTVKLEALTSMEDLERELFNIE